MKYNEKIEFIDLLLEGELDYSDKIQNIICELSVDRKSEIRSYLAQVLCFYKTKANKDILLRFLYDKDELVRVEAADSLCVYFEYDVYESLLSKACDDVSGLVRAYAIMSLIEIGIEIGVDNSSLKEFLYLRLKNERSLRCKLDIYYMLYILGEFEALDKLFRYYDYKDYRLRCALTSHLKSIANKENYKIIKKVSTEALSIEKAYSVQDSINNLLNYLESFDCEVK